MQKMILFLSTSMTICICAGCGSDVHSEVTNGPVTEGTKALPPITEPVHESGKPAETVLSSIYRRRIKGKSFEFGMNSAKRYFGRAEGPDYYQAILDEHPNAPADVYLKMGETYLVLGRFDTAISWLELGQKKSPPKGDLVRTYKQTYDTALKVKTVLTQARDSLRKEGVDVRFPDERIFLRAIADAPANDHYLLMNLADAHVAEFPRSMNARMFVAELNLGFFEDYPAQTNVPELRISSATRHGERTLEAMHELDKESAYPATRMLHHIMRTMVPGKNRKKVYRDKWPKFMRPVLANIEGHPKLTDAEKAYFLYGKAAFSLANPLGWETAGADQLISEMETAAKLDPGNKQYSTTLATFRANRDQINRMKLEQRKKGIGAPFVQYYGKGGPQGNSFFRFQAAAYKFFVDEVRKSKGNTFHADLMESVGCPACLGSGRDIFGGQTCLTCGGNGDIFSDRKTK